MALHPDFPVSPYDVLPPDVRGFPAAEELRSTAYEKLLPPLVAKIREEVGAWRDAGYAGASSTSRALLRWWFDGGPTYRFVYVDQEGFETHKPASFAALATSFTEYQELAP